MISAMKMTAAVLLLAVSAASGAEPKNGDKIEVAGKVATGIMAIGGETTGTTITTADNKTYELDLHGDKALTKAAEGLNGKQAVVTGTLTLKEGVEVGQRTIIVVATVAAGK